MNLAILVAFASALASPAVAYYVAGRKLSGNVRTSEASELWKESSSIREDYRSQLTVAWERIRVCELSIEDLKAKNRKLEQEKDLLLDEVTELKRVVNGD